MQSRAPPCDRKTTPPPGERQRDARGRQPATRDNSRCGSSWAEKAGEGCRFRVRAQTQHWGKMDDKLILAVYNYPELYNVTLPNYRCTESRANAWRNISMQLGFPCEYVFVYHNFTASYYFRSHVVVNDQTHLN